MDFRNAQRVPALESLVEHLVLLYRPGIAVDFLLQSLKEIDLKRYLAVFKGSSIAMARWEALAEPERQQKQAKVSPLGRIG